MKVTRINNINLYKNTQKNISMKAKLPNFNKIYPREYNLGNETNFNIDNLQNVLARFKNEYLSSILSKFVKNRNGYSIPKSSIDFFTTFDEIVGNVKDKKIAEHVHKTLTNILEELEKEDKYKEIGILMRLDDLSNIVDAYHTLNGNYSRLYKPDLWDFTEIRQQPSITKAYFNALKNNQRQLEIFNKDMSAYTKNPKKRAFDYPVKDFTNMQKYEPIANFKKTKNNTIGNYIYEKYYLTQKSIPIKHRKILNDIYKKTGMKVVISNYNNSSLEMLKMIKQEVGYWQKYSFGTATFPQTLIATSINEKFIDRHAAAYVDTYGNLCMNSNHDIGQLSSYLRYHLTHLNKQNHLINYKRDRKFAKLVNMVFMNKRIQDGSNKKTVLDFAKCKYKEEFLKAGIEPWQIEFGYMNKNEFLPIIASGDLSKCSDEFKDILLKFGLPRYLLEMPCPANPKLVHNVENVQRIMANHPKAKTYAEITNYYYQSGK